MNLVIDEGNTHIKYGIFDKQLIINSHFTHFLDKEDIERLAIKYPIQNVIYSSVRKDTSTLRTNLSLFFDKIVLLDHKTNLPFTWSYLTKDTIGKDRLAAAAGAIALFPNTNILVIDAGTAITYEFITDDNHYLGGNISLGLNMRFAALNYFTSALPLVEVDEKIREIGNNTESAIRSGVILGMINEIDGYIQTFKHHQTKAKIVITGGDAEYFVRKLKNTIFVEPNLVLIGLNRILEYNA